MKKTKTPDLDAAAARVAVSHEFALAKARAEAKSWKAKYNSATKALLEADESMDFLLSIQGKPNVSRLPRRKRAKQGGVAMVVPASDWHVEERVFPESVGWKNDFNLQEAQRRIERLYLGVLEMLEWQNHRKPVTELWHPMLGDLLSGYIHEELLETNELSPTEACVFLQDMITSGIDLLLRETKLPIIVPTCVGNHGRTTLRKRIKTSCKNSFEWLLYKTMAKHYESNPRVHWLVGEGYHNIQTIMGREVRFHHGDGLRYYGGVGGITIPVNKSVAQWQKVRTVDFDIFGHWHQFLFHYPTWVCCPSLIGYTEFSVEIKAEFQHPAQACIIIDKGLGISLATPIYLTEPTREKKR